MKILEVAYKEFHFSHTSPPILPVFLGLLEKAEPHIQVSTQ